MDRELLIQQLDQARAEMRAVLARVDRTTEIYPEWTIKHVLAHIAGWDDATAASLRAHAAGNEPATPAVRGIDHYNAESVSTRESLSYEHIEREWELARDQFKEAILNLSPEKLAQELLLPWGEVGTVAQAVDIFAEHELEHAEEIQRLFIDR